jgi:hypothetical protein
MLLVASCANYKQLKPKPEPTSVEQGYIELRHEKKNFELSKGKRYFITFPAPTDDRSYLVLSVPDKKKISSFLTGTLIDNKRHGDKIKDETPYPDTVSAYPIDKKYPLYYWIIDNVPADLVLKVNYRYAPQWRYKFETRHASFLQTLGQNLVDRGVYKAIGTSMHLDGFNFPLVLDTVARHTMELDKVHKELLAIESIFPANIRNSNDPAYQNYLSLKKNLEEEIAFQRDYSKALDFFYNEFQCRTNPVEFLGRVETFIGFFEKKPLSAENILQEARSLMKNQLDKIPGVYDQRLSSKKDAKPIEADNFRLTSFNRLPKLYEVTGLQKTAEFEALYQFVTDFQKSSGTAEGLRDSLAKIAQYIKDQPPMPSNEVFQKVVNRTSALQSQLPAAMDQRYGKYQSFACATALNQEITDLGSTLANQLSQYRLAADLVPQLNALAVQNDFRGMLGILKQYLQLGFLIDKYRHLDRKSIEQQSNMIKAAMDNGQWSQAESGLQALHTDVNYLNFDDVMLPKSTAVHALEDSLYTKVERLTRSKVNQFLEEKVNVLDNVDSLYTDSVFLPAYDITFSSGGKAELVQRKDELVADLARMKENEFPAKAIKLLYEQFLRNPDDNGVAKARAIVTHGNHYQGKDQDIKIRIAECNPLSAKWITKPKDYRRVFVLPVTDSKHGKNKYVFRMNVRVPTDAAFPVYDVNIKLPKEVAQNAATTQWYDEMKLNKKLLKNEGRFSITAPSAANNNECQITPVQMDKDGNNILEVSFTYPSFKVFTVSVMVQKPLIKKN